MNRMREMEIFVRVVETGSFSMAARDLEIGQPTISKTVAALEERLGVRLLVRSTRRLSPTEAGTAFYEHAVQAITEANEADAVAQGVGAGLEGRLRISAPVTFARLHLVPRLGSFLDAHPKLRIELLMDDRVVDLVAENIDAAIRLEHSVIRPYERGSSLRRIVMLSQAPVIWLARVYPTVQRTCWSTTGSSTAKAVEARSGFFDVALQRPRYGCGLV